MTRIEHKEAQYRHEIKNLSLQVSKLQDQIKAKLYEKRGAGGNKENDGAAANNVGLSATGKIVASNEVVFTKMSSENDMHLMISKSQEDAYRRINSENHDLKDCLKMLQRELFDIVKLKSDVYMRRFKAEHYKADDPLNAPTSEELLQHEIEKIREGLINMPFEESGREVVNRFKENFEKLRKFMINIDKGLGDLAIFNPKGDETEGQSGTSVAQLQELLRNYGGIVESQQHLLQTSISKMQAVPPPDEIAATFSRFQVLRDEEVEDMRRFLNEHKEVMARQQEDFEQERRQFEQMNVRMEQDKVKITQEREKVEQELRSIRALNEDLYA